ncbi:phage tail protein [Streptomyces sp. MBT56]|uniref:phage tail protein n=1 Tax=unclassified Streptomyces TaxID=2593676 RepID=UPI00190D413D|nr:MULTISPECIES: phage tail protein [unclassified Streptomyces]MBK3556306.1 phage tail protein [Streptomyces sp. MBT56]MBK3601228.1 phage tail protein [Streptomyces sp. MBT54]MBK3614536.1 phage tail protein [Streptomyces sp. MBT98]MBK6042819.1 phage tail protein [Streptomyces sp. MBT55]
MPLITAPVITPEEPPVVPPVEIPEVGYAAITYIDPTGRRWPMTDTSLQWYALAEGVSGLGAATYTLTSDPHPRGGARLRHVQPQPRTIVWPVLVKGADHLVFTANWRALGLAFTRTLRDGPGTLEVARPDGRIRRIPVYYGEGWDGRGQVATGITWDSAVVTLWCEDPYWVDAVPLHIHRESGSAEDFLVPYPTVSSSQVLGETVVTNPGDVEVWPEWVVTGPASLITFTREDTGDSFVLDPTATAHGALLAGEQVTISTDPPRVRYQDGSNWVGALNWPEASLWSLPPGDTPVSFQLDGATIGSAVDLTFHPRYEMA